MHITNTQVENCYKITFKGGIPEPQYRGATFPILGDSGIQTANLKEGNLHNLKKYWMDSSNFIISPESGYAVETVKDAHISPAIGPVLEAGLSDTNLRDFKMVLKPKTIFAMNQYYRQNIINLITIVNTDTLYSDPQKARAILNTYLPIDSTAPQAAISKSEDDDKSNISNQATVDKVKLLFDPSDTHPELAPYYGGSNPVKDIYDKIEGAMTELSFITGLVNNTAPQYAAYQSVARQLTEIAYSLDIRDITQEIFGYPDLAGIERAEASAYVPYDFTYSKKVMPRGSASANSDPYNNKADALKLGLGIPFIIRLYLKGQSKGSQDNATINFDLGKFLRLSIGSNGVRVSRKRSDSDVQELLSGDGAMDIFSVEQMEEIQKYYESTGNFVEAAEEQLMAMQLAVGLYTPNDNVDLSYSSVIDRLDSQNDDIDVVQAKVMERERYWRVYAENAPGGILSPMDAESKRQDLKTYKDEVAKMRKKAGQDEKSKRKIAMLNSLLYTQQDSVSLSLHKVTGTPLEIKVIDYGYGIVYFDFNNGKDVYIFKDKEYFRQNIKVRSTEGTKRVGISVLDSKSYTWLIADNYPPDGVNMFRQKPGELRISGAGGSFVLGIDTTKATEGHAYIPVVSEHPLRLGERGTINQVIDALLITNLGGYDNCIIDTGSDYGASGSVESDGGKITIELITPENQDDFLTPLEWKTMVNDIPGLTDWYTFVGGDADATLTQDDKENMKYLLFAKVGIYPKTSPKGKPLDPPAPEDTEGVDPDGKLIGVPILFRGTLNVHAIARPWNPGDEDDLNLEQHEFIPPVPYIEHVISPEFYNILVEPSMDASTRRLAFQVGISQRGPLPEDPTKRIPYFLPGKRVDIDYTYKGVEYRLMTDGIINAERQEEMLTITQPNDASSPVQIHGFYYTPYSITVFNVQDEIDFLRTKKMSEGLILEGYDYISAIKLTLSNSGFPESKLKGLNTDILGKGLSIVSTSSRADQKYIPISLPGEAHGFTTNEQQPRNKVIEDLIQSYGYSPEGNTSIWARPDGVIEVTGPFNLAVDPRFEDSLMVFRTDRSASSISGGDQIKLSRYTYQAPIQRSRSTDGLSTIIKVIGAINPVTKRPTIVGVTKHEAVSDDYINQPDYVGHHFEGDFVQRDDIRDHDELLNVLRSEYNKRYKIKELYKTSIPRNPFLVPTGIVFIEPDIKSPHSNDIRLPLFTVGEGDSNDHPGSWSLDESSIEDLVDCAWFLMSSEYDADKDVDNIEIRTLTGSEKNYLRILLKIKVG